MRKALATVLALLGLLVPSLAGCGGDDSPGEIVTDIGETIEGGAETLEDELDGDDEN